MDTTRYPDEEHEEFQQKIAETYALLLKANKSLDEEIRKRKAAEDSLRKREELYRILAENVSEVIWRLDMEMNRTYLSPSIKRFRGYTAEESLAQTLDQVLTPESLRTCIEVVSQDIEAMRRGEDINTAAKTLELEFYRKDGSTVWGEVTRNYLLDDAGKPAGIIGVSRDITERKRAEQERRRLGDRLRQAEKMEAIGILAGGIAFYFNSLLLDIRRNISPVLERIELEGLMNENLTNTKKLIHDGIQIAGQLFGMTGNARFEKRPLNINELVVKSFSAYANTRQDISPVYDLDNGIWTVEADKGSLEQVLLNIFVNAGKAVPHRGFLGLKTQNIVISGKEASAYRLRPGRYVKVSVRNSGKNMDGSSITRMIDAFFSPSNSEANTGLTLPSPYAMIRSHGGVVDFRQEKGGVTSYIFLLPAS